MIKKWQPCKYKTAAIFHLFSPNQPLYLAYQLGRADPIDSNDYKTIKAECENKLLSLEAELIGFWENIV